MNRLLIENLDYILTVDPLDRVVEAGAIVVEDDRLAAIGPSAAIAQQYAGARFDRVIDGCRTLAMPGLIDTHLHVTEQFARTLIPDNMPTRPTVFNWLMPFHAAATEEDEHVSMLCAGIEMLRTGTTCFLDMGAEENPEPVALGIERIGIRGITGRNAADTKPDEIPPFWTEETIRRHYFGSTEEALRVLERHVDRWHGYAGGRVRCWFNIQGKEPCSMALHVGVQRLATAHGVGTTYHAASTLAEAQGMEKHYGMWPITRLHHGGALGPNVVLAHAVAVREEEIRLLADAGTKVAFCPGTSLRGAKGATVHGKYPEMREGGVTVALGCDGAFAAGSLDMFRRRIWRSGCSATHGWTRRGSRRPRRCGWPRSTGPRRCSGTTRSARWRWARRPTCCSST